MVDRVHTMEYPYRKAYEAAVDKAQAEGGNMNNETLHAIGREAGKLVVLQACLEGKTWTSVTKESYSDYYGGSWDRINELS